MTQSSNNKITSSTGTRAPYDYSRSTVYRIINLVTGWAYFGSCAGYTRGALTSTMEVLIGGKVGIPAGGYAVTGVA